jgi:hypothetical protein
MLLILTPHYQDYDSLSMLLSNLKKNINRKFRMIIVDDGSLNNSINISNLRTKNISVDVLFLFKNVGHQKAISIGLTYIYKKYGKYKPDVLIMDSDGEDTPKSTKLLLDGNLDKNCDVVVARRKKRNEALFFRIYYKFYIFIFKILTGNKIDFGNFCILKFSALERMIFIKESQSHFAASLILSKLRIKGVKIDRGTRYFGSSKMNFNSLVYHGLKAIIVFSDNVLVRIGIFSIFMVCILFVGFIISILLKLYGLTPPGWLTSSIGILLILLLQTIAFTLMFIMISTLSKYEKSHFNEMIGLIKSVKKI